MPPRLMVLNEWIIHDLRGDNGPGAQAESLQFLRSFLESGDRLAVMLGSPWWNKVCALMGSRDVRVGRISGVIKDGILFNSKKCELLRPGETTRIPDGVLALALGEDNYLLETYYSTGASLLVTSDSRLLEKLVSIQDVVTQFRDDFLREYLRP